MPLITETKFSQKSPAFFDFSVKIMVEHIGEKRKDDRKTNHIEEDDEKNYPEGGSFPLC